jgi:hypothetical protein
MGSVAGVLTALVLVAGLAPAHASASTTTAPTGRGGGGGGNGSQFCESARTLKELYDAEAGIDMKDPRSVRKVQRVVADLQEVAPSQLAPSFRRLMHFYDLVISRKIRLLGDDPDRYFDASEPAARGAYRIAQVLQRRCRVHFRG